MKPEKIVSSQNILGEGPLWDNRIETLYWVDIEGRENPAFLSRNGQNRGFQHAYEGFSAWTAGKKWFCLLNRYGLSLLGSANESV